MTDRKTALTDRAIGRDGLNKWPWRTEQMAVMNRMSFYVEIVVDFTIPKQGT